MVNVSNQNTIKNAVQAAMKKLSFQRLSTYPDYEMDTKFIGMAFDL